MTIRSIGIREFRTNLHKYTRLNKEPITITSHGEPIGYYIPVAPKAEERDFAALLQATKTMSAMLAEKGLTIDDILADYQEAKLQDGNE